MLSRRQVALWAVPLAKGYDASDADGRRYQIKARRLAKPTTSRQLSALRDVESRSFDFLAGVLFSRDYGIFRAALIPRDTVLAKARFPEHTNSWRFHLTDEGWTWPGVADVTAHLRTAAV